MKITISSVCLALTLFILSSCASAPPSVYLPPLDKTLPIQEKLIQAAHWAEGKNSLRVGERSFSLDCTGVVLATYYYAGIDLAVDFGKYSGNGVSRLYFYLDEKGLLYDTRLPVPGDILFWDNTYDANSNGLADDYYTHVGMVVTMDRETGMGTYLHHNYVKGIVMEQINLLDPDNSAVNSALRMRSLPKLDGYKYLSSQLVRQMGKGYEVIESMDEQ